MNFLHSVRNDKASGRNNVLASDALIWVLFPFHGGLNYSPAPVRFLFPANRTTTHHRTPLTTTVKSVSGFPSRQMSFIPPFTVSASAARQA